MLPEPFWNDRLLSVNAGSPARYRPVRAIPRLSGAIWRLRRGVLLLYGGRVSAFLPPVHHEHSSGPYPRRVSRPSLLYTHAGDRSFVVLL